jgi:hypothetical protein
MPIYASPVYFGNVFGWAYEVHHHVQLPVAEFFGFVTFNIRKLKFCQECWRFHWEKSHIICEQCREEKKRPRGPLVAFQDKIRKAKERGIIKDNDQHKELLKVFKREGETAANRRYQALKDDSKVKRLC